MASKKTESKIQTLDGLVLDQHASLIGLSAVVRAWFQRTFPDTRLGDFDEFYVDERGSHLPHEGMVYAAMLGALELILAVSRPNEPATLCFGTRDPNKRVVALHLHNGSVGTYGLNQPEIRSLRETLDYATEQQKAGVPA